jgi:nucleoid DNA-binding protein
MNPINAKTIRDISQDIADKNSVSKKGVEELFSYFYQKVVKKNLQSFEKSQFSISHFGTFALVMTPKTLKSLEDRCKKSYAHYEEELKDPESPAWVLKTFESYKNIIKNIERLKKEDEEALIKKKQIKEQRKVYVG